MPVPNPATLKYLSGVLRTDNKGEIPYMDLLVEALNQLGVVIPNCGVDPQKGADGREVILYNDGTWIKWRYDGNPTWTNLIAVADLEGPAGPSVELRSDGNYIQWRVVGSPTWIDLIAIGALRGFPGADGREVEMRDNGAGMLQWRYVGDPLWIDLFDMDAYFQKKITVSATAPPSPIDGDLWLDIS